MENQIRSVLSTIIHPETGKNIVESGIVVSIDFNENKILIGLQFKKAKDPFVENIKKKIKEKLECSDKEVVVFEKQITEKEQKRIEQNQQIEQMKKASTTHSIKNIIAVASGKGGVGKSTVCSLLAYSLKDLGYKVGILDADIYGPSQVKMFDLDGYLPEAEIKDGHEHIIPAEKDGIKLISIGMFYKEEDGLLWRGTLAGSALRQLVHQTLWGELDFLLIDLPPGTGDIHLSIINEVTIDGAVIVSTPQKIALADVVRGVSLFKNENVGIPILGIIENMAYFSTDDVPGKKYYIFGKGGAREYAEHNDISFLGEIPIRCQIMEGCDSGKTSYKDNVEIREIYKQIALKIVNKLCV